MVFSAFRSARPGTVVALLALAAGVGALEGAFVLLLRAVIEKETGAIPWEALLFAAFALVLLRGLLQAGSARLETAGVFAWIAQRRAALITLCGEKQVPAYRAPWRESLAASLDRGLEDMATGAAAGLRCHAALVQAALLLPLLLLFSWKAAAAALALALPVLALSRYRSATLAAAGKTWSESSEALARDVAAFSEGLEAASGDGRLASEAEALSARRAVHEARSRSWELQKALFPPLLEGVFFAALAVLLFLALQGGISVAPGAPGSLSAAWTASLLPFAALLLLLHRPLRDWARAYPARLPGDRAFAAWRHLQDTLSTLPARRPRGHSPDGLIRVEGLRFAYPGPALPGPALPGSAPTGRRPVFDGLDAVLDPSAITWIPGPNGAGKTTLLRLLAGIEAPDGGSIALPATLRERARPFAYLPQRVGVAADYPEWARAFAAASPADWRRLDAILGLAPLIEREGAFRPEAFSGGQRQRLALARVFASAAPLLLLDEPTTGLAAGERERILGDLLAFRKERPGSGAVLVSHEPFLGEFCGATLRLDAATFAGPAVK